MVEGSGAQQERRVLLPAPSIHLAVLAPLWEVQKRYGMARLIHQPPSAVRACPFCPRQTAVA